jgi:hypothetical protein
MEVTVVVVKDHSIIPSSRRPLEGTETFVYQGMVDHGTAKKEVAEQLGVAASLLDDPEAFDVEIRYHQLLEVTN